MSGCPCNLYLIPVSGGAVSGGSADVTDSAIRGGVVCGGSARCWIATDPYDGLEAIWPLDEAGDGTADEYRDRARHQLHGTGGDVVPELADGVFCLSSQYFEEDTDTGVGSYIELPPDTLSVNHAFTVSCWLRTSDRFKPRIIYSRGFEDEDGNKWQFTLGYGWIRHVTASIQVIDSDGEPVTYEAFSAETLEENVNYHVAATWEPGVGLQVFVDGVPGSLYEVEETETVASDAGGYFGRWNLGAYPTAYVQEVRLWPDVKSEDFLAAEHDNFCDSTFYTVGSEELAP